MKLFPPIFSFFPTKLSIAWFILSYVQHDLLQVCCHIQYIHLVLCDLDSWLTIKSICLELSDHNSSFVLISWSRLILCTKTFFSNPTLMFLVSKVFYGSREAGYGTGWELSPWFQHSVSVEPDPRIQFQSGLRTRTGWKCFFKSRPRSNSRA
jgi:hypothetical protein